MSSKQQLEQGRVNTKPLLKAMRDVRLDTVVYYDTPADFTVEFSDNMAYIGKTDRLDVADASDSRHFVRAKSFVKFLREHKLTLHNKTLHCAVLVNAACSEHELLERFGGVARTLNARKGNTSFADGYNNLYIFWARTVGDKEQRSVRVRVRARRPTHAPSEKFLLRHDKFAHGSAYRVAGRPGAKFGALLGTKDARKTARCVADELRDALGALSDDERRRALPLLAALLAQHATAAKE